MSKITIDDIKTQIYDAEDFQKALEGSFNGKYFTLAKHNKSIYNSLKRFIERYNEQHSSNPTGMDEITMLLTGRHYTTNSDEYMMSKLRESMDESGKISSMDHETRVWLKNKHKPLKKLGKIKSDKVDIAEIIAVLLPEATYITQKEKNKLTGEQMLEKLAQLRNEEGMLDFAKNHAVRSYFQVRSKAHGISLEEEIRRSGFTDFNGIVVYKQKLSLEEHAKNLLDCANENHVVSNLSKRHIETYEFVKKFAKKYKMSIAEAINELLGDKLQSYTYRSIHNKLSKYRINDECFIGQNEKIRAELTDFILQNMDESGLVSGLDKNNRSLYMVLNSIKEYNGIGMNEIVKMFVPNARYEEREGIKVHTRETILRRLKAYDDGSGCIDEARKDKALMQSLRGFCERNGADMESLIDEIGGFYFSSMMYEVDHIDYVRSRLEEIYGETRIVDGISRDHSELYDAVKRIRDFFPEGALPSMEDAFNFLGFSISGKKRGTKFTEDYVRNLLEETFKGERKVDSLTAYPEVLCAIINYSGVLGKSVKQTLSHFGFEYPRGKDDLSRLSRKRLTAEEYDHYKSTFKESEPGDDDD